MAPVLRGNCRQRESRIIDLNPGNVRARWGCRLGDDRGRATANRLLRERRAVGVLPAQGDEHAAVRDFPRVVRDTGYREVHRAIVQPRRATGVGRAHASKQFAKRH